MLGLLTTLPLLAFYVVLADLLQSRGLTPEAAAEAAAEAGKMLGAVSAETGMDSVRGKGLPCLRRGQRPLFRVADLPAWAERYPTATPGAGG